MNIVVNNENSKTTLSLSGRIDTNTSPELQEALLNAFTASSHIVLDFGEVPYISSAGLRALLIGQKTANSKNSKMELINVSSVVKTVLDSVGFSSILTII